MSVLARVRSQSQQLLTIPILRSVEAFVSSDFDALFRNLITSTSSSYIVSGLTINIISNTFSSAASNLTIDCSNALILASQSLESGTILPIAGTATDSLNSSLNSKVSGNFSANATNYVSIGLVRVADTNSSSDTYLWDDNNQTAVQRTAYTTTVLDYRLFISTSVPSSQNILIATVQTNSLGVPSLITDNRPMLFRLGTGGLTVNPFYNYTWPQGQLENSYSSSSASLNPFYGGDKAIPDWKSWMNAVMSSIKDIKGTAYWYSPDSGGGGGTDLSLFTVNEDANLSYASSTGTITYNAAITGDVYWNAPIYIRSMISAQYYKIDSVAQGTLVMAEGDVQFVALTRYLPLTGNVSFSPSLSGVPANVVTASGSDGSKIIAGTAPVFTGMTSGVSGDLGNGDFIKVLPDSNEYFSQVQTFFDNTGATSSAASAAYVVLGSSYLGSTGSQAAQYNKTFYTGTSVTKAAKTSILSYAKAGQIYWLNERADPYAYSHFFGQFNPGETRRVNNETSEDLLTYIGASNESITIPNYSATPTGGSISANSGEVNYSSSSSDNLTTRMARLTSAMANKAQDKNISLAGGGTVSNASSVLTWNASITFSIGGPSGTITNYIPAGTVDLSAANYLCAYVTINRNASVSIATSVTSIGSLPLNENVYVFARKYDTADIFVGIDGLSYLIANNGSSLTGVSPSPSTSLGIATIHKWAQEVPAGSINSINTSFSLALSPYSATSVLLFKNGLFQFQSSTGDYSISGQNISFSVAPLLGDELVAVYGRGNNIVYSYYQFHASAGALTTTIPYSPACSTTLGLLVFLDGAQRLPTLDYVASPTQIVFNYTVTATAVVDVFYTGSGDNSFSLQGQVNETPSGSRANYSWYQSDIDYPNATLMFFDGVAQMPLNNTINNTSITVNDFTFISPQNYQVANSAITTGSIVSIWTR